LRWVIEEPSASTVFLDLKIQIENSRIRFSTFQKPMNLYLYIPPQLCPSTKLPERPDNGRAEEILAIKQP
jgi:hypothetical protein